ncbi:MAG TPA: phospho-N-acetylmuramoyl-pentapeptide-transferase [bacterium]
MLYHLLYPLSENYIIFNVFKYITFRSIGGTLTALLVCLFFGPWFIRVMSEKHIGQEIRYDGPSTHIKKKGIPTMGGSLILVAVGLSTLLWANLENSYVWMCLIITIGFGGIGFLDDYLKIKRANSRGLRGWHKFLMQSILAGIFGFVLYYKADFDPVVSIPFFKKTIINLGILYIFFVAFVIVAASNAVNLTDGLDGLAVGPIITTAATYFIFTYVAGHMKFSQYLQIQYIPGSGELAVFCGAIAGAGLGFLWYNTYPAQVFMGDVGSLSLGAAIGSVAILSKQELLLVIVGGIFILETVSVIFQVLFYKWKKERIFLMAPIHHHFEIKGWEEPKVTVRFWIVSIILALLALSTLKLR